MENPKRPLPKAQRPAAGPSSRRGYRRGSSRYAKSRRRGPHGDQPSNQRSLDRSFYSAPNSGRYRDSRSFSGKSKTTQTRRHTFKHSLDEWNELWQGVLQTIRVAAHHMIFGLFWGAISAGVGFWLTYWSPFAQPIEEICQLLNKAQLPLQIVLQPEILVLSIAGLGVIYSLTYTCSHDWRNPAQYSTLIAALSAVLAWLITQWLLTDSLAQNLAQFAAVLALGATISLGIYNFIYICVMFLGTYFTFWVLVHFQYWEPSHLNNLFEPTVGISASAATCAEMIILFALVGFILGFWNIASQKFVVPLIQSRIAS